MIVTTSGGRRWAVYVVAVFAAVLGGLSGTALGSWLSWRHVERLAPAPAAATRLAREVLPSTALTGPGYYMRSTFWNPYSEHTLHGGSGVRVGRAVFAGNTDRDADILAITKAAQRRMRARGWHDVHGDITRNGPHVEPSATATLHGERDGYFLAIEVDQGDSLNPASVELDVMWAAPPTQLAYTLIGGLGGALLGAALGWWSAWRMRGCPRSLRWTYAGLCLFALVTLAPACLGNIPTTTGSFLANTNRDGPGPSVYWGGFVVFGAEPLAMLSVLPILAALVLAAWPRRRPAP